jgi:hypothetical protein
MRRISVDAIDAEFRRVFCTFEAMQQHAQEQMARAAVLESERDEQERLRKRAEHRELFAAVLVLLFAVLFAAVAVQR